VFSSVPALEINALFNKKCRNFAGKFSLANPVVDGSISAVTIPVPQVIDIYVDALLHSLGQNFHSVNIILFLELFIQLTRPSGTSRRRVRSTKRKNVSKSSGRRFCPSSKTS
jgi:hypothetical protein